MHVIGTAGHVDHGKSSLLRLVTGMEPSRLAEEQRRGMSMQLGYVWMQGPDGQVVGILDVPGHADYRMAMIAGASMFDAFIFVCACDDGWMPQSEEQLFVLRTYGVRHGIIALTKSDLVDEARVAALAAELRDRFRSALGRDFPVVAVAAPTKLGEQALRAALDHELGELPPARNLNRPELYIDRSFTVTGQGTVVTGTLRTGHLIEKQRIEILPSGNRASIRKIQCYGNTVGVASPNSRVALQLSDLSVDEAPKGAQIAVPGTYALTATVDIRLRTYGGYSFATKKNLHVQLVHGGVKSAATLIPIAADTAPPGEPLGNEQVLFARLALEEERWIKFGDHLIIVSSGGDRILAGADVVDESPVRGVRKALGRLELMRDFSLYEYFSLNTLKNDYVYLPALLRQTHFSETQVAEFAVSAAADFTFLGDYVGVPATLNASRQLILDELAVYHQEAPAAEGLPDSKLAKRMALPPELLRLFVRELKDAGKISQVGPYLRLVTHTPRLDKAGAVAVELTALEANPAVAIYTLADLRLDNEEKRRILGRFIAEKRLVRLGEQHVMTAQVYQELRQRIVDFLSQHGKATAAEVRDALGIGRKIVILVLEAMDAEKLTLRSGEVRTLLRR